MAERIGQQLGNYIITRYVGKGGFAEVYLGEHVHLKNQVAIKILHTFLDESMKDRFREEARTIAYLRHSHIIPLLEFDFIEGTPYFVMDYAPYGSLRERYPKGTRAPLPEVVSYVKQIASALEYAHKQKIIHRDVKPENMLLRSEEEVLLSDFGIAVAAHSSHSQPLQDVIGTIAYMAPEQLLGRTRIATDQYALGVVVYEWLCGRRPFEGTSPEILAKHIQAPPRPLRELVPELSEAVESVVLKALEKEPKARYKSIQAFADELEAAYLADEGMNQTFDLGDVSATQPMLKRPRRDLSSPTREAFHVSSSSSDKLPAQKKQSSAEHTLFREEAREHESSLAGNSSFHSEPTEAGEPTVPTSLFSAPPRPPAPPGPPVAESPKDKCPYCGGKVLADAPFCPNCGKPVGSGVSLSEEQEAFLESMMRSPFTDLAAELVDAPAPAGEEPSVSDMPTVELPASVGPPETQFSTVALPVSKEQWVEEGKSLLKAGKYNNAVVAFDKALELDPRDAAIYVLLGDALRKLRRRDNEALSAYDKALELDAENADFWLKKGELLFRLERYVEALDACEYALSALKYATTGVVVTYWIAYAKVLATLKSYQEALIAYNEALKIFPRKWHLWVKKGEILYELKRFPEALAAYEMAQSLNRNNASIAHHCRMLRDLIDQQQEVARVSQALRLDPAENSFEHEGGNPNQRQPVTKALDAHEKVSERERPGASHTAHVPGTGALWHPSTGFHIPASHSNGQQPAAQPQIYEYDVFLSYLQSDADWVMGLAAQLVDKEKFRVWLDRWQLVPGGLWVQETEQGMKQSGSIAIFIGKQTPQGWFQQEIDRAQDKQARNPNFRVIPVYIPGADSESIDSNEALKLRTWVDFRGNNEAYAFYLLVCGIKGIAPGRWPPPNDMAQVNTPSFVSETEDRLRELRRLRMSELVDENIATEFQRMVLEKIWLKPQQEKENL